MADRQPSDRESPSPPCRLGLQGEVEGQPQTFLLHPGVNRVGSRGDAQVRLTAPGVSKRHALLLVSDEEVVLEDLGSKNGTFVAGGRVESTRLQRGDEVAFGPVRLTLQELSARDGVLAISLAPSEGASPTGLSGETSRLGGRKSAGMADVWLELIAELAADSAAGRGGLVSGLVAALGAEGGALFESLEPRPVLASTVGDLERAEEAAALALSRDPEGPGGDGASFIEGPSGTSYALAGRGPVLAIWGDYPGRGQSGALLRTALSLAMAGTRPPSTELPPSADDRDGGSLRFPEGYVVGISPAIVEVYRELRALAGSDLPILLSGETGVGKEPLARAIHLSSPRQEGPFVAINCAAIPAELLEAELFGIGKGVATGVSARRGKFQQAQGGTLLLDEVSEMAEGLQAKLLRALQEGEIHPVGGGPVPVDVRLVAATNADLPRLLEEGAFRRDLYYRLAGRLLRVPPLRQRSEDLPALVEHFLGSAARKEGKAVRGISLKALQRLARHPWPGNVRELEHEVRRLVLLCAAGQPVTAALVSAPPEDAGEPPPSAGALGQSLDLEELERRTVVEALRRTGGNQSRAAKLVGLSREALRRRMKTYDLL